MLTEFFYRKPVSGIVPDTETDAPKIIRSRWEEG